MRRIAVRSTAIRSVGYDAREKVLELEFSDGTIYQFLPVPRSVFEELMRAGSKGTYFDNHIRLRYIHRQVTD